MLYGTGDPLYGRLYLPGQAERVQVHDVHVALVRADIQPFRFERYNKKV
jgi:hypothetical protein